MKKSPAQLAYEAFVKSRGYSPSSDPDSFFLTWENLGDEFRKHWEDVADELDDYFKDKYSPRGWY